MAVALPVWIRQQKYFVGNCAMIIAAIVCIVVVGYWRYNTFYYCSPLPPTRHCSAAHRFYQPMDFEGKERALVQKMLVAYCAEPVVIDRPASKTQWVTLSSLVDLSKYPRRFYIDGGARKYMSSVGSWFFKMYPGPSEYPFTVYAFDPAPEYAHEYSGKKDVNFVPMALSTSNGSLWLAMTPTKGGKKTDMKHIVTSPDEQRSDDAVRVETIDFSEFLANTVEKDDFVVVKMDIETAEFELLPKLIKDGTIDLIDEIFLECHWFSGLYSSSDKGDTNMEMKKVCADFMSTLRDRGIFAHEWD